MLKALTGTRKKLGRWLDSTCDFMTIISGIIALLAVLLVSAEVVTRYGGVGRLALANEYSGYALVFIVFIAAATAVRTGTFVRLTFVTRLLPRRVQGILTILSYILGFIVMGFFLWQSCGLFLQSLRLGTTSVYVTYTPLAIPQSFIIVGLVLLELMLIRLAVKAGLDFMAERAPKSGKNRTRRFIERSPQGEGKG